MATVDAVRPLTDKQLKLYRHVFEHAMREGFQPSYRDICRRFRLAPNAVFCRFAGLVRHGFVSLSDGDGRAVRFLLTPDGKPFRGFALGRAIGRATDRRLTDRSHAVYSHVFEHAREHGRQPSFREVMATFGITSPNGVAFHFRAACDKGYADLSHGRARSLRFIFTPDGKPFRGFILPSEEPC